MPDEPVIVSASSEKDALVDTLGNGDVFYTEGTEFSPWVPLEADEILVQIMEINLDIDVSDEQIQVIKRKNEPDSPISLVIVDFDPVLNIFKRSWQHDISATNIRTFSLSLNDVIGDHKLEIVCFGTDESGRQTLSIFWRRHSGEGPELFYEPVCEIAVPGSIEIMETPRSTAYDSGMRDGESFSIITREHDPGSENILDIVQSIYYWDFNSKTYQKMQEILIPGEKIEEQQLANLYQSSDEEFLSFFNGPWYLSSSKDGNDYLIFFESPGKRFTLFSDNIQEIYRWEEETRTLRKELFLQGANELMPYITNEVFIRVLSLDSISIRIRDIDSHTRIKSENTAWSGTYVRLKDSAWRDLISHRNNSSRSDGSVSFDLIGKYNSDDGSFIVFNRPSFTLLSGQTEEKGLYSLYSLGNDYLELRIFDAGTIPVKNQLFQIDYSEVVGVTEIVRTISLTAGRMSTDGFVIYGDPPKRYEQIESMEAEP